MLIQQEALFLVVVVFRRGSWSSGGIQRHHWQLQTAALLPRVRLGWKLRTLLNENLQQDWELQELHVMLQAAPHPSLRLREITERMERLCGARRLS